MLRIEEVMTLLKFKKFGNKLPNAVIHKTQVRSIPRAGQDQTECLSF